MIKLYTHQACSWCQKTRNLLQSKEINFKEYDISKNDKARGDMINKSGQIDVPVIDIKGIVLVGFNKSAIEAALKYV